jgi:copper transport protein
MVSSAARRLLAVLVLAAGAVFGLASQASAHAILERTDPSAGSMVTSSPAKVTLGFSESVRGDRDSIRVLDSAGKRVDDGHAGRGSAGDEVVVRLRSGLPKGTYVVTWRVVSADSHPISGAFAFGVGVNPDSNAAAALGGTRGSQVVGGFTGAARIGSELGLVLLVGVGAVLVGLWPAGLRLTRARWLLTTGWGVTALSAIMLLFLEGPYTTGRSLSSVLEWNQLSTTVHSQYGRLLLLRLLLLALAVPLLRALRGGQAGARAGRIELAVLGVGVLLTESALGHASTGSQTWLAVGSLTAHLAGVCVWLGGLAVLGICLLRREHGAELSGVLPRWSRTAMAAVTLIVVSGLYQAWREVGTLGALGGTLYGKLLLAKLALFGVLLGLGYLSRQWVVTHFRKVVSAHVDTAVATGPGEPSSDPDAGEITILRRSVGAEAVIAAGVLVVAAILANTAPGRVTYGPPFHTTIGAGPVDVSVTVSPTRRGVQTVDVTTRDPQGQLTPVAEVDGQLLLPSQRLGPLPVTFREAGAAHVVANGTQVPLPGRWQLRLTIRVDDFDQYVTTLFYQVH